MPIYDVKFRIRVSYQVGEFKTRGPTIAAAKAEQLFIRTVKTGLECGGIPSPSSIGFDWLWGATVSRFAGQAVVDKWEFSFDDGDPVPLNIPSQFKARRMRDFSPEDRIEMKRWIAKGIPRGLTMEHFDTDRYRNGVRSRRELIEAAKTSLRRRRGQREA